MLEKLDSPIAAIFIILVSIIVYRVLKKKRKVNSEDYGLVFFFIWIGISFGLGSIYVIVTDIIERKISPFTLMLIIALLTFIFIRMKIKKVEKKK